MTLPFAQSSPWIPRLRKGMTSAPRFVVVVSVDRSQIASFSAASRVRMASAARW